jgi:Ku70/Ku80 beta-barrel domain
LGTSGIDQEVLDGTPLLVRSAPDIPCFFRGQSPHSKGSQSDISFHQISRSTGERGRHQKVLQSAVDNRSEEAAAVVEKDEIVKGCEYSKGQYVIIEPSELENLRVPLKHVVVL